MEHSKQAFNIIRLNQCGLIFNTLPLLDRRGLVKLRDVRSEKAGACFERAGSGELKGE